MEKFCPNCHRSDNFYFHQKKTGKGMRYCRICRKAYPEWDFYKDPDYYVPDYVDDAIEDWLLKRNEK
jgi:hypothetical protein